ncbi:MAG: Na/Pi cotransporter family protein, partial [Deltaproteobacteria bacterium]|nr:Na/Pi cotransporter family protein [Deltaproteobacteria bacterium]
KHASFPAFLMTAVILQLPTNALAADDLAPISWPLLIIGLIGGLAFFLYGMEKMSDGMKKTAGNRMRSILAALTKNRVVALTVGAFVTMLIQSSSATTVMLVSFVQAELMSFAQSLGVILGADIGTTITAQMIAFKLTDYALIMVAVGFCLRLFGKNESVKSIGDTILGFGILFYGMKMMSDAMKPLRTYAEFIDMMKGLENPFLGLLIGTVFTALVQSSSASTGVVIVLAQQGLITLEAGIPVIFGANIGTCITAGLASIGTSREAKRVAIAHVLFKVAGVLLFIWWIPQFSALMKFIAQSFGAETARQIANAHTFFNVSIGLLFLPFIDFFARLVIWMLPDRPISKGVAPAVWHLDDAMLSTPALAIDLARSEMARMAKIIKRMHFGVIHPLFSNAPKNDDVFPQLTLLEGIEMRKRKIDFLESRTRKYLLQISRRELDGEQATEIAGLLAILNNIRRTADIITRTMVPQIERKNTLDVDFSDEGKDELLDYHMKAGKQLERLENVLREGTKKIARKIKKKELRYSDLDHHFRQQHIKRLLEERPESIETHRIHMAMIDAIKQINIYTASIAEQILAIEAIEKKGHKTNKGSKNKELVN